VNLTYLITRTIVLLCLGNHPEEGGITGRNMVVITLQ